MAAVLLVDKPRSKLQKRKPRKYKQDLKIKLLDDIFSNGGSILDFCIASGINRRTYFRWLKQYPMFRQAHNIFIHKAKAFWERAGIEAVKNKEPFDYRIWMLIGRNRFKFQPSTFKFPNKSKTVNEKFKVMWAGLKDGTLNFDEYNRIALAIIYEFQAKIIELKLKRLELAKKQNEIKTISNEISYNMDELIKELILLKDGKVKVIPIDNLNKCAT